MIFNYEVILPVDCDYLSYNLNVLFSWKAPRYILNMPNTRNDRVRKKFHILVDGDGIPPPIKSFREMKLPPGYTTLPVLHMKNTRGGMVHLKNLSR